MNTALYLLTGNLLRRTLIVNGLPAAINRSFAVSAIGGCIRRLAGRVSSGII